MGMFDYIRCDQPLPDGWQATELQTKDFNSTTADCPTERGMCERCQGNGEIVIDWDRYLDPHDGDVGDEAVAECPDCNGEGFV